MTARLLRRLRTLWHRDRVEDEIQRELEFHVAMEAAERERCGLSPAEARRTTLRDFGALAATREAVQDVRGMTFLDGLSQDARFAVRTLRRWPGFTAATILTLALGIGANTAIFSVIDDVLLEPLPYADGNGLVRVQQSIARPTSNEVGISINELEDYRRSLRSIQDLVEYHSMSFVLLNHGEPDRVDTGVVSANFFDVLGVRPVHGRNFADADDDLAAAAVVLLSHQYWMQKFGGDPAVVGRSVQMNDKPHRIIGVLPPIPQYPRENDVYMPISACPFRAMGEERKAHERRAFGGLRVFGRLRPGVSVPQADAEVGTLARQFGERHPGVYEPSNTSFAARIIGLNEEMVVEARPILFSLLGTTALVLLIACANVANLALSRMARRDREMAVRLALGAGRGRLVRQLLTESSMLACAAGVLGLGVAWASLDLLKIFVARFTPRVIDPTIDPSVLLFTLVLSLASGVVFGIVPAFTARPRLSAALHEGGSQTSDGPRARRIRAVLVVAQVSICFALLVGAGLFLDSLRRLTAVDLGYRADRVLTAEVFSNWSRHTNDDAMRQLYTTMLGALKRDPGVVSAAITNAVPLSQIEPGERPVRIDGITGTGPAGLPLADQAVASEEYFQTLGIPLIAGRTFTAADNPGTPRVAVINQSMARLWGDRNPVGGRFLPTGANDWHTVIGVVTDVRQYTLERTAAALYYTPFQQTPGIGARVLVRTHGDPMAIVPALKAAVFAADQTVPVERIETLQALRAGRLASPQLNAALLSIFAGIALLITVAGIGAVVGTSVSQRTREFGVRIALGARPSRVLTMVLREGLGLAAVGVGTGAAAAVVLSQVIATSLYGTTPTDPMVYLVVALVFLGAATAACLAPARRATTIDPLLALKSE